MGGYGRAPKFPEERANRVAPMRGDWLTLPPLSEPVLPPLPEGDWSERTQRAWEAWRADWVTGAYGPSEIAMAVECAYLFEAMVRSDSDHKRAAELRQWMERLGLTPKGRRDLRLRLGEPVQNDPDPDREAFREARRLRLMNDDMEGTA